ncbi:MAG: hypothetical protein FWE28_08865 [Oscillospiraceae bacterium]|nr:hypothetical protein [Oscillospiraceae bacterium]
MKRRVLKLLALGAIFTVAVIMGSAALAQLYEVRDYTVTHMSDIADHPAGYLVRNTDGYIGVYYQDGRRPIFITEIPMASLGEYDRNEIKQGISVATRQELIQLLEDLGR